jgi:hypothetical protein
VLNDKINTAQTIIDAVSDTKPMDKKSVDTLRTLNNLTQSEFDSAVKTLKENNKTIPMGMEWKTIEDIQSSISPTLKKLFTDLKAAEDAAEENIQEMNEGKGGFEGYNKTNTLNNKVRDIRQGIASEMKKSVEVVKPVEKPVEAPASITVPPQQNAPSVPKIEPELAKQNIEKVLEGLKGDLKFPGGYNMCYDQKTRQVQIVKGEKVVSYFSPEKEENKGKMDTKWLQKWIDRRTSTVLVTPKQDPAVTSFLEKQDNKQSEAVPSAPTATTPVVGPMDGTEQRPVVERSIQPIEARNIPEIKKIDFIGKSIDDFNAYIQSNYPERIKQENGVAKWVVVDRKSEFSLVITQD